MKNIQTLVERSEVLEAVHGLWKTNVFREAMFSTSIVAEIVSRFASVPRFFAEVSNDTLERAHFSTWWNVVMIRDYYTNPFIHDLYLLHEMYHAAFMPYVRNIGRQAFEEKMQRNELEASVMSEIQIYLELPALRAASFEHPIYADRFLTDPYILALWKTNRSVAIETIRTMRRDVMVSKPEHLLDLTERWVRRFADQNSIYASIWDFRYAEVENHMADFYQAAAVIVQAPRPSISVG